MPGWQLKSDWLTAPRNPTYQDLQNIMLDQGRAGVSAWGGDIDAGGNRLLNCGGLSLVASSLSSGNFQLNSFAEAGATEYLAQHGIFFRSGFGGSNASEAARRNASITTGDGTAHLGDCIDINGSHHVSIFTTGLERFRVLQNGNVGIGTLTPQRSLEVVNNATWGAIVASGNGGTGRVVLGNFANCPTIAGNNADLTLTADLSINPGGGRVGIGTSTPQWTLDVNGYVGVSGVRFLSKNATINYLWSQTGGSLRVTNGAATTDIFTILDGGNVGVGTPSPGYRFVVEGGRSVFVGANETYGTGHTNSAGGGYMWAGTDSTGAFHLSENAGVSRLKLEQTGRLYQTVLPSAVPDVQIFNSGMSVWYDESGNRLVFRVRNAAGTTLKTGYVNVA